MEGYLTNLVAVGIQWGDEGKGKIVDLLAPKSGAVVRFQGGANAGHTLVIGNEKTVLHIIPSGILHEGVQCIVGNGVVVDPVTTLKEIEMVKAKNLLKDENQLVFSDQAQVVLSYHKEIDRLREEKKSKNNKIGTTGRGIGPCYEDKSARQGIRLGELVREDILFKRFDAILPEKSEYIEKVLGGRPLNIEELKKEYFEMGKRLSPFVKNTQEIIKNLIKKGKSILFEGAQGTALDIDHGTYPFVTSSNTIAPAAGIGSGVGPNAIDFVLGISKAYCTRVGNGPFMTELGGEVGEILRKKGGEFGATTGRPRRCGWIDLVYLKYAVHINGVTGLALTKLDVLSGFDEIKLCTSYDLNGEKIKFVPTLVEDLDELVPQYEQLEGWTKEIRGVKNIEELPGEAKKYIRFIEDYLEVPVVLISTGPERDANIIVEKGLDGFGWGN